jgi:hypothetical protein
MALVNFSTCCDAPAILDVDNEVSKTYICSDCWQPCDVIALEPTHYQRLPRNINSNKGE